MPWISINQWKTKNKIGIQPKKRSQKPKKRFKLIGFDTFSSEWYNLSTHATEAAAEEAAQEKLRENERHQPTASSGGQAGIQDQVHIERPDGTRYRVFPKL